MEHDPRFESSELKAKNNVELIKVLDEILITRTLAEWKPVLDEAGVPWSPCQSLSEVVSDPQAIANDFFVTFDHPEHGAVKVIGNPINFSKTPTTIRNLGPEFSQHTEEVLLELGYTWESIRQLRRDGVIA